MNLKVDIQLLYRLIYKFKYIELGISKIFIKTNLLNNFILPSKFPNKTLILFLRKLDISYYLYVDYQSPNNLIIRN